jgi:hypothetical protein
MATTTTTPEPFGAVPPDNQPGHHPEVEQDKPTGPPPGPRPAPRRFHFEFHPLFRLPALLAGVTPMSAHLDVDDERVRVTFGRWRMEIDRDDVESVTRTGPYRPWKVIGPPHLSLADRGITFATTNRAGVCISLRRPVAGIEPTGLLKHPAVTVTVEDPDELVTLLGG